MPEQMPPASTPRRRPRLARAAVVATVGVAALGLGGLPAVAGVNPAPAPNQPATSTMGVNTGSALGANTGQGQLPAVPTIGGSQLSSPGVIEDPAAGALPYFDGTSYVIADATTGDILAARNPHGLYRPASTQKSLLALTMLPRLDADDTYTADKQDVSVEGTRVGMAAGQTYSINDLWYALFLRSGNDAALGLAKAGADGDLAKAVRMENEEAQRLQAYDTTVVSPSGLDEPGQFSSAYDLALFGRALLNRGDARKYMATQHWLFPGNVTATKKPADPAKIQINSENRLLGKYPGIIGVKPGYTTLAHNTDIVAAQRDGRTILVSLMGVPHPTVTQEAAALLDWGFAHDDEVRPVGQLVDPLSASQMTPEDDGFSSFSVIDKLPGKAASGLRYVPISLRWSAVSGGVAAMLFAAAGVVRVLGRRRWRRRLVTR
jgi:D-alanyl-D-alanine carboxypeptidase (penicillin-binding protein 5/6)